MWSLSLYLSQASLELHVCCRCLRAAKFARRIIWRTKKVSLSSPVLIPRCASPLWTKVFTWLWNEKNVCVGEQRDPTCYERLCVCECVKVCVSPALILRATPSRCELCLLTTCMAFTASFGCVDVCKSPGRHTGGWAGWEINGGR